MRAKRTNSRTGSRGERGERRRLRSWGTGGLLVAAVAAVALVTALSVGDGEAPATASTDAAPAAAPAKPDVVAREETSPPARGGGLAPSTAAPEDPGAPSEGIRVRGTWTIDVLDPDGTLVRHVEFENALQAEAANWLANALNVGVTWGVTGSYYYALFAGDTGAFSGIPPVFVPGESPCDTPRVLPFLEGLLTTGSLVAEGCYIVESDAWALTGLETPLTGIGTDMGRGAPVDEQGLAFFVAEGSVVANQDGQIDRVESFVWKFADPDPEPFDVVFFTARSLDPVPVVAGQRIEIVFEVRFQ